MAAVILSEEVDSSKLLLTSVNILLQTIGQLPVESEEDFINVKEASMAYDVIIETKREVLSDEWDFNRDTDYTFPVDVNGFINIPYNVLDIYDVNGDNTMRDWKLYSKSGQTSLYDEAQTMNVVWDVKFNNLTHPIRNYITIRAARKFQARQVMDERIYSFTAQEEESALMIARRSEARTGRYNLLTSGSFGTTAGTR